MACECTTDSDRTGGSPSPLTVDSVVTFHAPVWPPLKVVNMRHRSVEPGRVQAGCAICTQSSRNDGGAVNSGENPNNLRILRTTPYIHDRLAPALDSPKITPCASRPN